MPNFTDHLVSQKHWPSNEVQHAYDDITTTNDGPVDPFVLMSIAWPRIESAFEESPDEPSSENA